MIVVSAIRPCGQKNVRQKNKERPFFCPTFFCPVGFCGRNDDQRQPDTIYDGLIRSLFSKFHRLADRYEVCVAKRGAKDRNQAIRAAIEHAERDFEQKFGFSRGGGDAWDIVISNPKETVCLQAVDYFLWAAQRFYEARRHPTTGEEIREDRYLKLLWPQIGEIHDLDFGPAYGTYFTAQRPLTLEERFGGSGRKKGSS